MATTTSSNSNLQQVTAYNQQINAKQKQLATKQQQQQSLRDQASEIGRVYDRLARDKDAVRGHRQKMDQFANEEFQRFAGNLYSKEYKPSVDGVTASYDVVISKIDAAMDALNNERMRCENEANSYDGVIGQLKSGINWLYRQIQNLTN